MKTQISKPARERTSYTEEYKQEALALWRNERSQRGQGGGGVGHSPTAALSLGALGASARGRQERAQATAQLGRTGDGEPASSGGEHEALGAA